MNAITKMPLRQVANVRDLLRNDFAKGQLASVAANHMNPDRMMRLVANAIRTTPRIAECDPMSLLGGLMTCASLGLEPNTVLGHAYLVPFRNRKKNVTEVQVIIGYKGLIDLARRSGHITSISANIHYSDDDLWDYEEGTESRLRHRPGPLAGEKQHAYAIAKFTDGGHAYVVMPWAQVMARRDQSQNWKSAVQYDSTDRNPWTTHEDEMAKKTAIRALAKYLPLSIEFRHAVELDETPADYGAYAMDPTGGLGVDGETIEGEAQAEPDQDPVEDRDPEPEKPKAKTVERKAKAEKSDEDFSGLVSQIKVELQQAADHGAVEAVLDLYADQIEPLRGSEPYNEIQQFADARREEIANA